MSMNTSKFALALAVALPLAPIAARADDAPAAPTKWSDTLKLGAQIEAGIAGNPAGPKDNLNYGSLYTDRANEPVINQILLSIGRPLDPKATSYDFGFKVQGLYGTDARYTHFAHLFDSFTRGRYQPAINEASVSLHTPWLTEGGVDYQAGLYPTLLGYETIDTSTNPFYSHSYIYNFGLPVNHAGGNAIWHATGNVDIYLGVDAGNQTIPGEDNNGSAAFIAGTKLTFLDGNFTLLALTHFGPENASRYVKANFTGNLNANNYNRAYNDVLITYKANEKLTFTTEANYVAEDLGAQQGKKIKSAEAFGLAQYASYALTDTWTANMRAEVFSDTRSFFVAGYPTAKGPIAAVEGLPYAAVTGTGRNTYGALTVGATYKPEMPEFAKSVVALIRPEARIDSVMNGNARYNGGKDRTQYTLSADLVLTY